MMEVVVRSPQVYGLPQSDVNTNPTTFGNMWGLRRTMIESLEGFLRSSTDLPVTMPARQMARVITEIDEHLELERLRGLEAEDRLSRPVGSDWEDWFQWTAESDVDTGPDPAGTEGGSPRSPGTQGPRAPTVALGLNSDGTGAGSIYMPIPPDQMTAEEIRRVRDELQNLTKFFPAVSPNDPDYLQLWRRVEGTWRRVVEDEEDGALQFAPDS